MSLSTKIVRMLRLRKAYRTLFRGDGGMDPQQAAAIVLEDLTRFCRVNQSSVVVSPVTRQVDTHATMVAEGRREVFNRCTFYANLTEDQIMQLKEQSDET